MSDKQLELYRAHRTSQDKYDYFILAASGASTAFALSQTNGQVLGLIHITLGVAVLCWGLSFYSGCKHLLHQSSVLFQNYELLRVQSGLHPLTGTDPVAISIVTKVSQEAMEKSGNKAAAAAQWQFRLLLLGAILYIIWHVSEMYYRVPAKLSSAVFQLV